MGEHAEGIGVALEVDEVGPLGTVEQGAQALTGALAEKGADGLLARVPEGRIAQVVGEAGGGHDVAQVVEMLRASGAVALAEGTGNAVGQRLAHARHFHGVRQAVVHEDAARQGENLCLVLQTAERRREHKAVVVASEVGAQSALARVVIVFQPETLVVDKVFPAHQSFHGSRLLQPM